MKAAENLATLQAWFGEAISHPLPIEYDGNPLAVSHLELEGAADSLLNCKGGPSGFDRLGIYNQQYWFRLVSIMQSEYPCGVHILGLHAFNQWAIRYLTAYPPSSPFLAQLDRNFSSFMQAHYAEETVLGAIAFDRAYSKAFDAPDGLTLAHAGLTEPMQIMSKRLCLAPHITPLSFRWDFMAYRKLCRLDESLEAKIELEPLVSQVIIHRSADLEIQARRVSRAAFAVLVEFQEPILLTEVFTRLEGKLTEEEETELSAGLMEWFQVWVSEGWFCLADGAES